VKVPRCSVRVRRRFNGAVHCVDDTPELDDAAVPGALDDPPVVDGDGRMMAMVG
jgi:hypothetical protein